MSLVAGAKLGPYEIQSPLGAGGMGEVYRARDTRLDRTVAIKVLNSALSATPDLRARFEREARTISQLNHPNICVLHDIGHQDGADFLVMEYLEGESLADRIKNRGALPLPELIRIGCEIADALDKAHRAGIVHRDLKPGNIMLTKTGAKLLDFGLAKPAVMGAAAGSGSAPLLSAAMTMTSPSPQHSPLTQQGSLVGTVQYMSPEQIQGIEADARSDIFAFGAVLYEMATGKRAFEGKSQIKVASAILEDEPQPVSAVQKTAPPALDHVIATCLAKDPEQRWQSAADVGRELHWIANARLAVVPSAKRSGRVWLVAGFALLMSAIAMMGWFAFWRSPSAPALRLELALPEKYTFGYGLAVSPDGSQVCFVADDEQNHSSIACRGLNSNQLRFLSGTDDARFPFWSPDGAKMGFFASGKLKTVDLASGATQVLADSDDPRGADWGADGQIIFSPSPGSPLWRISAVGGTPIAVTKLDGALSDRWPHFFPDGKHFLFYRRALQGAQESKIFVGDVGQTTPARELMSASSGVVTVPGYVIFVRGRTLFAQRFNEANLRLEGEPVALAQGIEPEGEAGPTAWAPFTASRNGILLYRESISAYSQLAWFDRSGKRLQDLTGEGAFDEPALSPDGTRLVVDRSDGEESTHGIWMLDLVRGTFNRFSLTTKGASCAVWSPDGKEIVFGAFGGSRDKGGFALFRRPSNGTAPEQLIAQITSAAGSADGFSPDGRYLIYETQSGSYGQLWVLPTFGDRKPFLYLPPAQYDTTHAAFSPDGHWVAYSSNETGRAEVYVQSFPDPHSKMQISTGGGDQASWSQDGKELFYFGADRSIVSVPVNMRGEFAAGKPKPLFLSPMRRYSSVTDVRISYALSRDGKRILMNARGQHTASAPLNVVVNWPMELKK